MKENEEIEIIDLDEATSQEEIVEIIDLEEPIETNTLVEEKEPLKIQTKHDRMWIIIFIVITILVLVIGIFGKPILAFIQDLGGPEVSQPKPSNPEKPKETEISESALDGPMLLQMKKVMKVAMIYQEGYRGNTISNLNLLGNPLKLAMTYQLIKDTDFAPCNNNGGCLSYLSIDVIKQKATILFGDKVTVDLETLDLENDVLGVCARGQYQPALSRLEVQAICQAPAITSPQDGILVDFYQYKKNGNKLTVSMKYLYRKVAQENGKDQYTYYTQQNSTAPLFGPLNTVTGTDQQEEEKTRMKEFRDNLDEVKYTFELLDNNQFKLIQIESY